MRSCDCVWCTKTTIVQTIACSLETTPLAPTTINIIIIPTRQQGGKGGENETENGSRGEERRKRKRRKSRSHRDSHRQIGRCRPQDFCSGRHMHTHETWRGEGRVKAHSHRYSDRDCGERGRELKQARDESGVVPCEQEWVFGNSNKKGHASEKEGGRQEGGNHREGMRAQLAPTGVYAGSPSRKDTLVCRFLLEGCVWAAKQDRGEERHGERGGWAVQRNTGAQGGGREREGERTRMTNFRSTGRWWSQPARYQCQSQWLPGNRPK